METSPNHRICIFCETWKSGGIEGFLSNVLLHTSQEKCGCVDIVVTELHESVFIQELKQAGIRFIELSGHLYYFAENYQIFKHLLRNERYNAVHVNAFQGLSLYYLKLAAEAGVPVRIAHSHNSALRKSKTKLLKDVVHILCKKILVQYATDYWACSGEAAKFMFPSALPGGQTYRFVPNGIDLQRFKFDPEKREIVRKQLCMENAFVIGNVGRLCYQKNQSFLIDIFAKVKQKQVNSVLLLVGDGEDQAVLEQKTNKLGLSDSVIFYGTSSAVEQLLWGMDVFVFPSRFEGFGIAVLEAQASGLPVICSDRVPNEARALPSAVALPLSCAAETWANQILHAERFSGNAIGTLKSAGFDIDDTAQHIWDTYQKER